MCKILNLGLDLFRLRIVVLVVLCYVMLLICGYLTKYGSWYVDGRQILGPVSVTTFDTIKV